MKFMSLGGVSFQYQRDGHPDGLPLVFVNSLGTDLRIWDDLILHFQENYQIFRYDKRGHGLSDSPPPPYTIQDHAVDLAGLINSLNVNKPVVVGISVGGMIAFDYTAAYPDHVAGLILCDTYPKIGTAELWNERILALRANGMAHLSKPILERWFDPAFAQREPAAYQGYLNMLERMPVSGYTGTCEAIRDADLRELTSRITCPVLVVCGQNDMATPPDLVRSLADELPDARFTLVADAGHLPCVEQPETMAQAVQAFLKEIGYG